MMNPVAIPTQTAKALQPLGGRVTESDRIRSVLLANIDGHRSVIELKSFARALGLEFDELSRSLREGRIDFAD